MSDVLIEARGLHKTYGRTEALRDVSIDIAVGDHMAITGPSGSGKSTLLLLLAGILRPDSGEIRYAGTRLEDLSETERTRLRRREFGVVLQFGQLVPELTALQNVALPLMLERHDRSSADLLARRWLERLDAAAVAKAVPGELSGGEAQRVAVARALVTAPRVVFADEPTGSLDTVSGEALLVTLYEAAKEADAAVVMVTHDNRVAARADREVRLVDGVIA